MPSSLLRAYGLEFFSPDSLRSQTRAYSPNVFVEENISRVVVVVQSLEQLDPSDSLF